MMDQNPTNGGDRQNNDSDEFFTLDMVLQCLVHPRRRQILYVLQDEPIITEEDLARRLSAIEYGQPADEVPGNKHEQVRLELRQRHLPKLEDTRVLEYDRRSATIRYTDPPSLLELFLHFTAWFENDDD